MRVCRFLLISIAMGFTVVIYSLSANGAQWTYDFDGSFQGWDWQWDELYTPGGSDGVVSLSTQRGYNDSSSLKFDMGDGAGDDGTLWIEKAFTVPSNLPTKVSVYFQLFNLRKSDVNQFQVKAYIGQDNPEEQEDFQCIGRTDSAAGWVPFEYNQTIESTTGQVWVALGIRVTWEGHRDYWIDHVQVNIVPTPATLMIMLFGGIITLGQRRSTLNNL